MPPAGAHRQPDWQLAPITARDAVTEAGCGLAVALVVRSVVACLLVVAACTEAPPDATSPEVTSRIGFFDLPYGGRSKLDLLFVVDSSTAMAPYREPVVAQIPQFADALASIDGGMPDLNIAVTSADFAAGGALRTSSRVDGAFVIDGMRDGVRVKNYTGELGSALAELADIGATSPVPARPLDVLPLALDDLGFVREYSYLLIVVISATDDASVVATADLAAQLKAMKADPTNVIVVGVYPRPATRLDDFLAKFPNRTTHTEVDAPDISEGFAGLVSFRRSVLGSPCIEWQPLDVDPETAGEQYDCVIEHQDFATKVTRLLPRCSSSNVFPCWDMRQDPQNCVSGGLRFDIEHGYEGLPYEGASMRGQCLIE